MAERYSWLHSARQPSLGWKRGNVAPVIVFCDTTPFMALSSIVRPDLLSEVFGDDPRPKRLAEATSFARLAVVIWPRGSVNRATRRRLPQIPKEREHCELRKETD